MKISSNVNAQIDYNQEEGKRRRRRGREKKKAGSSRRRAIEREEAGKRSVILSGAWGAEDRIRKQGRDTSVLAFWRPHHLPGPTRLVPLSYYFLLFVFHNPYIFTYVIITIPFNQSSALHLICFHRFAQSAYLYM